MATRLGLPGITPAAEVMMIERDLRLVELTGARYHAAHVSTAAAIEAIRGAKQRRLPVTCDTAPPLFRAQRDGGRRVSHLRQIVAAFAQRVGPPCRRRGACTTARSTPSPATHAPHDQDSKRLPFTSAESGIIGLEDAAAALARAVPQRSSALDRFAACAYLRPPPAFSACPPARLAIGAPADLVLFDPRAPLADRRKRFPLEIEELALRRPPGPGRRDQDRGRRPASFSNRRTDPCARFR